MRLKRKKSKIGLFKVILLVIIIIPAAWILIQRMEGEKPSIQIELKSQIMGLKGLISGKVSDYKSGIRKIKISILKNNKEFILFKKSYPARDYYVRGGIVLTEPLYFHIEPRGLGITDGKATLRVEAWDYSCRGKLSGNRSVWEKELDIDTNPPEVRVISKKYRIIQGGTGLVIYEVSEKNTVNGVVVGKNFFPGYSGYYNDRDIYIAFYSLGYNQTIKTKIYIKATDQAGNIKNTGFRQNVWKQTPKKDILSISNKFLKWKMPLFDIDPEKSLIDQFLIVNSKIRKNNYKTILETGKTSEKKKYWEGVFKRLPSSAQKAAFADYRSYYYNGRIIDHQYHLGLDLASVKNAPIPASNNGIVVKTKNIGIFGNTIIIDHGFGLFSTYSHLSEIFVKEGQIVTKGETIGRTGITGLTGGDHLHYGMFINQTFVNPLEWLQASWVKNNITDKLVAEELINQ